MTVAEVAPVGFIGLGQIGTPIATRLLGWPGGLIVCDVQPEATARFAAKGAAAATTPRAVAEGGAAVICVMVRDDEQVRDVLFGADGIVSADRPGTIVVIHSTISPATAETIAVDAAANGVEVVDAPVSGGVMGAHAGTLAVMVGGSDAAVERIRPVLDCMATLVVHAGPPGAATRMKVARNLITFASFAVVGEAQRLAAGAGISLRSLAEVVRHTDAITGGPGAIMIRDAAGQVDAADGLYAVFSHTRDLGEKDLELAIALAHEVGVEVPIAALARASLGEALGVSERSDG